MSLKKLLLLIMILVSGLITIVPNGLAQTEDEGASNGFVVSNIQVEGNQHISSETILNYLPIKKGQVLKPEETPEIIQALVNTGFFSDVSLDRRGNTLVIHVAERSIIGAITFSGNSEIKTAQLQTVLKEQGIIEGQVLNQASIAALKQGLEQQYINMGFHSALVFIKQTPQPRGRVAIHISINEKSATKVQSIQIVGNKAFSKRTLMKTMELTRTNPLSFFTKDDQFNQERWDKDLEKLRSYYMDRGYMQFKIDSTDVSMSPDKKRVVLVVHITEGPIYTLKGYQLEGNFVGQEAAAEKIAKLYLKPGKKFNRQAVLDTQKGISDFLATIGYALATVRAVPQINEDTREITITFQVEAGQRVYVRRISFIGNSVTAGYVLRRELRQQEGSIYSLRNIEEGKRRLSNLGYIENIEIINEPVPEMPDQVDLIYKVKDANSASASANVGWSSQNKLLYGANLTQSNFLGGGKTASLAMNNSLYAQAYSFSYFDPYFTLSGIQQSFGIYYQRINPNKVNLANFRVNALGSTLTFGFPLTERDAINWGFGYENTQLIIGDGVPNSIRKFVREHGQQFNQFKTMGSLTHQYFDRAIFATRGFSQSVTAELGLPITQTSLDYYKLGYNVSWYQPLFAGFIFHATGTLGYGNGYGDFNELPFFKNYYAGGIGTVRGYAPNSLGPADRATQFCPVGPIENPADPDEVFLPVCSTGAQKLGGNVLTIASASLILPSFIHEKVRTSLFLDVGNVFNNNFVFGGAAGLRYSAGIDVQLILPVMGPIELSFAVPLKKQTVDGVPDNVEMFQFSIGASI
jgi:outer membrane protein insertion porin family